MSNVEQPPEEVNAAAINWGPCAPAPPRPELCDLLALSHLELLITARTFDAERAWWRRMALQAIELLATATSEIKRLSRQCHQLRAELRGGRHA